MKWMLSILCTFSITVYAEGGCDFPVPAYKISEGSALASGISKDTFMVLMAEIERQWAPVFQQIGCDFVLHKAWDDGTVNAQAWQEMNGGIKECHVQMFGGLARFPGQTRGGMKLVVLHEIGHHLGGAPFYSGDNMSCEGQADMFAGAHYHSAFSALVLSGILARLNGEPKPYRPGPRLKAASVTYCGHPAGQCRLNTMDAGRFGHARPRCWFKP